MPLMYTARSKKSKNAIVSRLLLLIALCLLAGGVYIFILVLSPSVFIPMQPFAIGQIQLPKKDSPSHLYIPKIGVNNEIKTGGQEALDYGIWHRFPERGDPANGGNFILSAHRFEIGITPGQTWQKSPFYHIEKLEVGDQIVVDFQGQRYFYTIDSKKRVKPTDTDIEAPTTDARMTLYTCTLRGSHDGREVIFAKLVTAPQSLETNVAY